MPTLPTLRGLRRPPSAAEAKRLADCWDGEARVPSGLLLDPPPGEWLRFATQVRGQKHVTPDYLGQTRPECAALLSGIVAFGWSVYIGVGGSYSGPGRAVRRFMRRSRWASDGGMLLPLERAAFFTHEEAFDFVGELEGYERQKRRIARPPKRGRRREWYAQPIDWFGILHELGHIAMIERERAEGRDPAKMPEREVVELECAVWELKLVMAVWGPLSTRVRALVAVHYDNHDKPAFRAAWGRVPGPDPRFVLTVKRAYARAVAGSWSAERSRSVW